MNHTHHLPSGVPRTVRQTFRSQFPVFLARGSLPPNSRTRPIIHLLPLPILDQGHGIATALVDPRRHLARHPHRGRSNPIPRCSSRLRRSKHHHPPSSNRRRRSSHRHLLISPHHPLRETTAIYLTRIFLRAISPRYRYPRVPTVLPAVAMDRTAIPASQPQSQPTPASQINPDNARVQALKQVEEDAARRKAQEERERARVQARKQEEEEAARRKAQEERERARVQALKKMEEEAARRKAQEEQDRELARAQLKQVEDEVARRKAQEDKDMELARQLDRELNLGEAAAQRADMPGG
ncbi:hypothetical protein B0H11DRAFT_1189033 [Mycena galericulata]|nr:hypothetical protein B0H11DRAFT_1189033 [Mycena galericulata]